MCYLERYKIMKWTLICGNAYTGGAEKVGQYLNEYNLSIQKSKAKAQLRLSESNWSEKCRVNTVCPGCKVKTAWHGLSGTYLALFTDMIQTAGCTKFRSLEKEHLRFNERLCLILWSLLLLCYKDYCFPKVSQKNGKCRHIKCVEVSGSLQYWQRQAHQGNKDWNDGLPRKKRRYRSMQWVIAYIGYAELCSVQNSSYDESTPPN